jgi:hypothetical protein
MIFGACKSLSTKICIRFAQIIRPTQSCNRTRWLLPTTTRHTKIPVCTTFKTFLYAAATSKETQTVFDTMQCRFCNAVTSAAVRIYECEDEATDAFGNALTCLIYTSTSLNSYSGLVQKITPVNMSFISDLQANSRFSKSSVLRSCDWKLNRAGLLTVQIHVVTTCTTWGNV